MSCCASVTPLFYANEDILIETLETDGDITILHDPEIAVSTR